VSRSTRALSLLILLALAPACRKPSIHHNVEPPSTNPPTAVVTAPVGTQTGIFSIAYVLSDAESNKAKIVPEWSTDGGTTFFPATRAEGALEGVTKLTTSPGGTGHTFLWDSALDGVGKPSGTVRFRITPSDTLAGVPGTADFTVDNAVTAFRIDAMALRDPHMFFRTSIFAPCEDITDSGGSIPNANPGGLNGEIQDSLTTDGDNDGFIDSSPLLLFRMFDQAGPGGKIELASGRFVTTASGDLMPDAPRAPGTYANVASGTVLAVNPGTTKPYAPAVVEPTGPGFVTDPVTYTITSGKTKIPLEGYRMAGTYNADPATSIINGITMGFISEANAEAITIQLGSTGSTTLAALLAGGSGGCAMSDDRDLGPDGVTLGWWFYYNWTAQKVTYTGP
jgi:hypothetical protein